MQSEGATIKAWVTSFWGARLKFPQAAANWISLHTETERGREGGRSKETVMLKHHLWANTDTQTHTKLKASIHTNADKENNG